MKRIVVMTAAVLCLAPVRAAELKIDLSKERVGRPPTTFEPMVGTWVVAKDGSEVSQLLESIDAEKAQAIGRAALKRVLAEHTYAHRAELVDEVLDSKLPHLAGSGRA